MYMLLASNNYYSTAQSIFNNDEFRIYIPALILLTLYVVMQWKGKLPSVQGLQDFSAVLNSRGGNILILVAASFYFFRHSVYLFYALMQMSVDGHIQQDNAFALMALQFVSSTAFGGAFGALLKTMTGENSKARATDVVQTTSNRVTVSAVPIVTQGPLSNATSGGTSITVDPNAQQNPPSQP